MKTHLALALAVASLCGAVAGALAMRALHAKSNPMAFVITEIQVTDPEAYRTEYAPKIAKVNQEAGAIYLARGGKTVTLDGAPPEGRVVVLEFENWDTAMAWRNSAAHKALIPLRDKYSKTRSYVVEGAPPAPR